MSLPVYPSVAWLRCSLASGAVVGFLYLTTPVLAADRAPPARGAAVIDALAVPATSPITLDGRLPEPVWEQAPSINEFVQREPSEGAAPSQRTDARVAFDDKALYVAVRAFDSDPTRIVGMLTRRDQRSPSDWIKVVVDSYFDRR